MTLSEPAFKELMRDGFTVAENEAEAQQLAADLITGEIDFSVEYNPEQASFTFKLPDISY